MQAEIIHKFPEHHKSFDVLAIATNLGGLVKLLVDESDLDAQKNERELHTNEQETRAFLGIN